ncbi:MAG: hypothetical protein PVS2B2_08350 [Candidatus Acidiferrum sp.]
MGDKSDQIERYIREQRNELGENISELQEKVKDAVDWRVQFEDRPMTMIGLAFGSGLLLSALLPSRSRSRNRKRSSDEHPDISVNGESVRPKLEMGAETLRREVNASETWKKASNTLQSVQGALIGVAASKVGNYLEQLIPGFNEHYSKLEARRS